MRTGTGTWACDILANEILEVTGEALAIYDREVPGRLLEPLKTQIDLFVLAVTAAPASTCDVYERVKDYWSRDLNVNIGQNNFDELRFEYFRDTAIAVEAFKADQVDWRASAAVLTANPTSTAAITSFISAM